MLLCVKTVTYNATTGIIALTWQNGSTLNIDLPIEKIPVSFSMDENGVITMTNADGTSYTADIGSLIKTYNFIDSDQIDFTATLQEDGSYSVAGTIKGGSITDAMLESGYLASVTAQASSASTSSQNATAKATLAESYAKGGTNTRTGEDTDNAKYYSDRASALVDVDIATTSKAGIVKPDGTTVTVDADGTIHSPGGHTHANKATLDSITEGDLLNWNAKADTVSITQSGTIISLNDAKNASLQSIKLYGKSTQSGTPTVEIPIPIVDTVNPKITVSNSDNSQTQEVTISGTYRSVNTVKDIIDSVSGKITRKLGIAVFDGSDDELWENGGRGDKTTYRRFILTKADKKNKCVLLCSHFQYAKTSAYGYNGEAICKDDTCTTRIDIVSTQLDLASWKTWLANNPITVIYELATPIETDISYETLTALRTLTTYNPITNIGNDNSCDMDITYQLGVATNDSIGFVKPDGTTITVDANGVITATAQSPGIATPLVAGIVKFDDETIGMDENDALYVIGGGDASGVLYSNTASELEATNVQDAIDEVNRNLANGMVKFKVENGDLYYSVYTE